MDIMDVLEAMAGGAEDVVSDVSVADVDRWQSLFGLSAEQAAQELESYRSSVSSIAITDKHWELVREKEEAIGFDREAYAYAIESRIRKPLMQEVEAAGARDCHGTYLIKLEGRFATPKDVQDILGASVPPKKFQGLGEDAEASFCTVSGSEKEKIIKALASQHIAFRPTFVRLAKAKKDLSATSYAPCLGFDATLPQHRLKSDTAEDDYLPRQEQYPVWYLFYGKLAEPDELQHRLDLDESPSFRPAQICYAQLRRWAGRYNAVIDGSMADMVSGSAFLVKSQEQEEALQFFETDMYEVVRCRIDFRDAQNESVPGLCFRFCGPGPTLDNVA